MKSARLTYLLLALLAFLFVAFNLASAYWLKGVRIDLTDQSLYTLSDGTETVLGQLQSPLTIELYFSEEASRELPTLRAYARRVQELLEEYQAAAGDKLQVRVLDPEPFSEAEDAATLAGLQAVPAGPRGENLYFGLVGRNGQGQEEVLPFLQLNKEQFLEYELTRMIHNLNQTERPVVGILSGLNLNGGFDMLTQQREPAWVIVQQLEDLFEVRWIPEGVDEIDPELDVLMLVHPKSLSDKLQFDVDQYLMKGGKALVFVDPLAEADQPAAPRLNARPSQASNPERLLRSWGVRLRADQVVGDYSQSLVVSVPGQAAPVRHLTLLGLEPAAFNLDEVILAGLDQVNMASAGSLEAVEGATTQVEPILLSSPESGLIAAERLAQISNPEALYEDFEVTSDIYTLAVRVTGPAVTAFPDGVEGTMPAHRETQNLNLLVFADTDLLTDRLWVQVQDFFGQSLASPWADNGNLVVNAVENLSGDAALLDVRSRGRFSRPFEVVEELRLTAEQRLRENERTLQNRLRDTEEKLAELEQGQGGEQGALLNPEQQQALAQFQEEKLRIRKELRDVQHELNRDIETLGRNLKLVNILLVPALLTVLALLLWWLRRTGRKAQA